MASYCSHGTGELNLAEELNIHSMGVDRQPNSFSATHGEKESPGRIGAWPAKADCVRLQLGGEGGGEGRETGDWGNKRRDPHVCGFDELCGARPPKENKKKLTRREGEKCCQASKKLHST